MVTHILNIDTYYRIAPPQKVMPFQLPPIGNDIA